MEKKFYEVVVNSKKYLDSIFSGEIPFDVKYIHANEVAFGLKMDRKNGTLKIYDSLVNMSERITEKKAVTLTFNQKLKIQESMLDNRVKREMTEKEAMEYEDDSDPFER